MARARHLMISIHAPLAGCDSCIYAINPDLPPNFNPRTPCGVRPGAGEVEKRLLGISIHAPLAGCDLITCSSSKQSGSISIHAPLAGCDSARSAAPWADRISIHAPLAGCDRRVLEAFLRLLHFNPRTPCGVRQPRQSWTGAPGNFNPRTPCGVRPMPAYLPV